MKLVNTLWTIVALTIMWQFNACTEDNSAKEEQLLGRWELMEASRNGKVTESLAELFFEFFPEGKMRTNINGTAEETLYKWTNDKLLQREGQRDIDYTIVQLEDSTLIMTTEIQGFSFRLVLTKQLQEE